MVFVNSRAAWCFRVSVIADMFLISEQTKINFQLALLGSLQLSLLGSLQLSIFISNHKGDSSSVNKALKS